MRIGREQRQSWQVRSNAASDDFRARRFIDFRAWEYPLRESKGQGIRVERGVDLQIRELAEITAAPNSAA